jgi:hypothetical protein
VNGTVTINAAVPERAQVKNKFPPLFFEKYIAGYLPDDLVDQRVDLPKPKV